MFIFSSNSARYVFEYKISRPYRVDHKEKVDISPSILSVEHYQSIVNNRSAFPGESFSTGVSLTGIRLRELLLEYRRFQENVGTGVSVTGVRIKDTLINLSIQNEDGDPRDEARSDVKVTGIRLRTTLIENKSYKEQTSTNVSVKGIRRS